MLFIEFVDGGCKEKASPLDMRKYAQHCSKECIIVIVIVVSTDHISFGRKIKGESRCSFYSFRHTFALDTLP